MKIEGKFILKVAGTLTAISLVVAGSLVVKTNIDAVSGATVTTKGITKGANAALAAAEAMA